MPKRNSTELMQVRDVARYLGINEKKVYFLAKAGKIPSTRVTGKWTFPKKLIDRWIEESASGLVDQRRNAEDRSTLLVAGSDDPGLGILYELYAARTRPASVFMATVGSSAGVAAVKNGIADVATAHLLEPARPTAGKQNLLPADAVVVALFYRELGLLLASGNPKRIRSIRDLARPELRFVNRQTGSGTRIYLDQELTRARLSAQRIAGYDDTVSTHMQAGLRVLRGEADVTLATRTTAELLKLNFLSLTRERFDILVRKERFFTPAMQTLLGIVGSREFRERIGDLGGYDVTEAGRIVAGS